MSRVWKIFARLPSEEEDTEDYAAECYQRGVIAVGWSEVGHLNQFESREDLNPKLIELHREWFLGPVKPHRLGSWASSLWHFKESVQKGDLVLCPDRKSRDVYLGRVLSERVFYDRSPLKGKCKFAHRRERYLLFCPDTA
jgi:predicted Mrr-cat superfamily restriction endonuclease